MPRHKAQSTTKNSTSNKGHSSWVAAAASATLACFVMYAHRTFSDSNSKDSWNKDNVFSDAHHVECSIDRRTLTEQEFVSQYYELDKPVIFESSRNLPNAATSILQKGHLIEKFGDVQISVGQSGTYGHGGYGNIQMKLSEFVANISQKPSKDLYFFDSKNGAFLQSCQASKGATPLDAYTVPPHFKNLGLWESTRPRLTIGTSGAGIPFHSHSATFNEQVVGRKRWALYAPGRVPRAGYNPSKSQLTWLEEHLPFLKLSEKPLECIQNPGDILWIPDGWDHATLNMEDCVSVAWNANRARENSAQRLYDDALQILMSPSSRATEKQGGLSMLKRAVQLSPANAHYENALANAFAEVGNTAESLRASLRARKANPQVAIVHEGLAQGYLDSGLADEAFAALVHAAELDLHTDPSAHFENPLKRLRRSYQGNASKTKKLMVLADRMGLLQAINK